MTYYKMFYKKNKNRIFYKKKNNNKFKIIQLIK